MHQVLLADTLILVVHLLIDIMMPPVLLRIGITMLQVHLGGTLMPLAHLRTDTLMCRLVHHRETSGWIKPRKSSR